MSKFYKKLSSVILLIAGVFITLNVSPLSFASNNHAGDQTKIKSINDYTTQLNTTSNSRAASKDVLPIIESEKVKQNFHRPGYEINTDFEYNTKSSGQSLFQNTSASDLRDFYADQPLVTGKLVVYENKKIRSFIKMYTTRKRSVFQQALIRYNTSMPTIRKIFSEHRLPLELTYLAIVESNLNPKAISRARAVGIWQFIAATGKRYGLDSNIYYDDRFNIKKSSHAAARHLKDLYTTFGNWELALAAYNSGAGNVRRALKRNKRLGKSLDFWSLRLPRETRGYVPAFFAVNLIMQNLSKYGFDERLVDNGRLPSDIPIKQIKLKGSVSFKQVEKHLGIDHNLLTALNPEYKYLITPPYKKTYSLNLPVESRISLSQLNKIKPEPHNLLVTYRVKRGDNFYKVARKHGTTVSQLRRLNPKVSPRRLSIGKKLVVAISATAKKNAARQVARTYRVIRGDTLSGIASNFGISLKRLVSLNKNKISLNRPLQIGTRLVVR